MFWALDFFQSLPEMGEIYPLGGAGDRLGLVDEVTGECLPVAMLPYCGRTLLEGLVRDLQVSCFSTSNSPSSLLLRRMSLVWCVKWPYDGNVLSCVPPSKITCVMIPGKGISSFQTLWKARNYSCCDHDQCSEK